MMHLIQLFRVMFLLCCITFLSSCGGGAGAADSAATTTPATTATTTATTAVATLSLNISSAKLQAGSSATVIGVLKDAKGLAVANTKVTFKAVSTNNLVIMKPVDGVALTNAEGKVTVVLNAVAPSVGGVVDISASATVDKLTVDSAVVYMSIDPAPLILGKPSVPASAIPTKSTNIINVPVTAADLNVASLPVSALAVTSMCAKELPTPLATLMVASIADGVAAISYTNNGCTLKSDIVTVTVVGSSPVQSVSAAVAVLPPPPASAASLIYVSAVPSNALVVKGTGAAGRQETSTLTFKLLDASGQAVPGVTVNFIPTTIAGGIKLDKASTKTDATGQATVTLSAGSVPTPLTVLATVLDPSGLVLLSTTSSLLSISAGPPEQKSFSLSVGTHNIDGDLYDGTQTSVNVRLSDYWGNSVADGTVISMISEGANITNKDNSNGNCLTDKGACSMVFTSAEYRPSNRRVSITAFAAGVETFADANKNGQFDSGESCGHLGAPFIDNNEDGIWNTTSSGYETLIANISPSTNAAKPLTPCALRNQTYVFAQDVIVLSGKADVSQTTASLYSTSPTVASISKFPDCSTPISVVVNVKDRNGNPVPASSKVSIDTLDEPAVGLSVIGKISPATVPDTIYASQHVVTITPNCGLKIPGGATGNGYGKFNVVVETPSDIVSIPVIIPY
jgi:hypothetical protein